MRRRDARPTLHPRPVADPPATHRYRGVGRDTTVRLQVPTIYAVTAESRIRPITDLLYNVTYYTRAIMAGRCRITDASEGFAAVKTKVIDSTIFIPSYTLLLLYTRKS